MSTAPSDIAAIHARLISPGIKSDEKVQLLKAVVQHKDDPRALDVLRAAAAAPCNGPILHVIVRTLGYLPGDAAVAALAEFALNPDEAVMSNALKAAAARSSAQALSIGLPILKGGKPELVKATAVVLAERCRPEADSAVRELGRSSSSSDRLAAINFWRAVPPAEGAAELSAMRATETHAELRELLERIAPAPAAAPAPVPVPAPTPAPPPAGAQTRSLGQLMREEASRPAVGSGTAVIADKLSIATSGRIVVVTVIVVAATAGLWSLARPGADQGASRGARVSSLGAVGARVAVSGSVSDVNRDYNVIVIRTDTDTVVSAFFRGLDVKSFRVGQRVAVRGTIHEVRAEDVVVVKGEAVQLEAGT